MFKFFRRRPALQVIPVVATPIHKPIQVFIEAVDRQGNVFSTRVVPYYDLAMRSSLVPDDLVTRILRKAVNSSTFTVVQPSNDTTYRVTIA